MPRGTRALPGESGELLLTGFFSWSMPFIRYRIGDRVTAGELGCPCGARVSTLLRIEGRTDRPLRAPRRSASPSLCARRAAARRRGLAAEVPVRAGVRATASSLRLMPLPGAAPPPDAAADLERRIASEHSLPWRCAARSSTDIEHRPGGKFRLLCSAPSASRRSVGRLTSAGGAASACRRRRPAALRGARRWRWPGSTAGPPGRR